MPLNQADLIKWYASYLGTVRFKIGTEIRYAGTVRIKLWSTYNVHVLHLPAILGYLCLSLCLPWIFSCFSQNRHELIFIPNSGLPTFSEFNALGFKTLQHKKCDFFPEMVYGSLSELKLVGSSYPDVSRFRSGPQQYLSHRNLISSKSCLGRGGGGTRYKILEK